MKNLIRIIHKTRQFRLRWHLMGYQGLNATSLSQYGLKLNSTLKQLCESEENYAEIESFLDEGLKVYKKFSKDNSGKFAPYKFDGGENLCIFLFAWILATKPKTVVETGVASGITTNVILEALAITGGNLYSLDINPQSSKVYCGKYPWNFILLRKPKKYNLSKFGELKKPIDLWIHDSDHSYKWQKFEYEVAKKSLSKSGILVSDDIDTSAAFGEFVMRNSGFGNAIYDGRKFFGLFRFNDANVKFR